MNTAPIDPPTPEEILNARTDAGLTQAEAAALVHTYDRLWRNWETGSNRMPLATWELFRIKVAQRGGGEA